MDIDKMHAEFEASMLKRHADDPDPEVLKFRQKSGRYGLTQIEGEWIGWQDNYNAHAAEIAAKDAEIVLLTRIIEAAHCALDDGDSDGAQTIMSGAGKCVIAAAPVPTTELEAMTRMFHDACADLGAINEALGLDPDDGGAGPILDAIEELKCRTPVPAQGTVQITPNSPQTRMDAQSKPLLDQAQGALTDDQIEALVPWAGNPDDPHFDRIAFARSILAQSAAQGADDARDAVRWRLIMRAGADSESPEAKAIEAADALLPAPDDSVAAAAVFEAMVDSVIASLAEVPV